MKAKVHFWHANISSEYLGRVGHRVEVKVPGAKNACLCITLSRMVPLIGRQFCYGAMYNIYE